MLGCCGSASAHACRRRRERADHKQNCACSNRLDERILVDPLNNWRKHRADRTGDARTWNVDPFSTGVVFWGWKEREGATVMWQWRESYQPLVVYLPRTWLLSEGWKRRGGLVRFREVPSAGVAEA